MGLLDETDPAVVRLASIARVAGHTRGKSSWVDTYVRTVLDSFGEGANADTKRGIFVDRLNALKAQKGTITEEDVTELRKQVEETPANEDAIARLRKKNKKNTANPFFNKTRLSVEEDWINIIALGRLERAPGKNDNWIERVGGKLPRYIEEVAHSLHTKQGMSISRAIATAISRIKVWSVTGEPDTKAKALAALAEWNALKLKNKSRGLTKG